MRRIAIATTLLPALLIILVPPGTITARPPVQPDRAAEKIDEMKKAQERTRRLAALKSAGHALTCAGPMVGDGGIAFAVAGIVERYRTDQYTVYFIKGGYAYHKSSKCQTLRKSKDVLSATLTDAVILSRKPCLACSPPE
jgi:hypothetical protein